MQLPFLAKKVREVDTQMRQRPSKCSSTMPCNHYCPKVPVPKSTVYL